MRLWSPLGPNEHQTGPTNHRFENAPWSAVEGNIYGRPWTSNLVGSTASPSRQFHFRQWDCCTLGLQNLLTDKPRKQQHQPRSPTSTGAQAWKGRLPIWRTIYAVHSWSSLYPLESHAQVYRARHHLNWHTGADRQRSCLSSLPHGCHFRPSKSP